MNLKTLAILFLSATLGTSCVGRFSGGGFIPGAADPNQKATFGFTADASDSNEDGEADTFKGQFQYNDESADTRIHGTIDLVGIDNRFDPPIALIAGDTSTGDRLQAVVTDAGEPGLSAGDTLDLLILRVVNDPFPRVIVVYRNRGVIGGGNIQYKAK